MDKSYWKNISVQWKFQIVTQSLLIAILVSTQFWLSYRFEQSTLHAAQTRAESIADGLLNSMNTLMLTGITKENRKLLLERFSYSEGLSDVRILRNTNIDARFGEGLPEEYPRDERDKHILAAGKTTTYRVIDKNGKQAIRVDIPFIASAKSRNIDCLSCHGVAENEILGAASVTLDISSDVDSTTRLNAFLWIGQFALQVILFIVMRAVLQRAVVKPLSEDVLPVFHALSNGKYDSVLDTSRNDEIGKVFQGLDQAQRQLEKNVADAKRVADETLRVKIALDNVSTGVMIANGAREIIYINKAVQRILKGAESDLRKHLPNFNADQLIGANIDAFHKNPSHQANLLSTFTSPYTANLQVGNRYLRVTASPVINDNNERLGAVAEWLDRTQEVLVENEVADIVDAVQHGDFNQRLKLEGKEGFFRQLAEGLNSLSQVTSTGLSDVARVLQAMAQGDLTQRIESDYGGIFGQLKDNTNSTVERLCEVIGRIKEATVSINTAAQEIAAGNQDLSQRTEQQASSLEETSSSMEELSATVRNNAESATKANALAKTSSVGIQRGGEAVGQVVVTMGAIQESSKKIADIIGVIDSIAFQTNILALNAAVEAARAGEQGRGFAVVATEVRNLAQRSATAAKEIKDLIAASVEKVEVGVKQVEEAGTTMTAVINSFAQVAKLVTDIANASREQSAGIEQVTQAVGSMDEVTQQNAALVEEATAAAESLEEQARGLVQAVGMFKIDSARGHSASLPVVALRTISQPELPNQSTGLHGLDFDGVLKAHQAWKEKLRVYMAGQGDPLDPAVVECDDKCALGQWIYGDGKALDRDMTFMNLRRSHAEFHHCAAKIVRSHQVGDERAAYRILAGDFGRLTHEVVDRLRELRQKYQ